MSTDAGEVVAARHCVLAVGCLSSPKRPDFAGLEGFRGEWYHTYVGGCGTYRRECDEVVERGYAGFVLGQSDDTGQSPGVTTLPVPL